MHTHRVEDHAGNCKMIWPSIHAFRHPHFLKFPYSNILCRGPMLIEIDVFYIQKGPPAPMSICRVPKGNAPPVTPPHALPHPEFTHMRTNSKQSAGLKSSRTCARTQSRVEVITHIRTNSKQRSNPQSRYLE